MVAKNVQPLSSMRQGSWADFRADVKKVAPDLFDIIEKISPNKKYKLMEVTYQYGEKITDYGTVCLPDNTGKPVRLDDPSLPDEHRHSLNYGPTPLILQLSNCSEVFVDTGERIVPLNIFTPGDLYGLFEAITPLTNCHIAPCWSVTAGARSVFMGAKVTDAIGHKRLRKEYGIKSEPSKKLSDQWDIIKTIAKNTESNYPWTCKILIFTKEWLEPHQDNLDWVLFHNHLLVKSWIQSKYMRSKSELSIMWEAFSSAIRDKNLKPGPYILDTIMHNIFLASGSSPGFVAADQSELTMPSLAIEKAYEDVYLLKEYSPVVMHPWRLGAMEDFRPIYYSLAYPTLLEGTPSIRHAPSIISEISDVKNLMQTLSNILEKNSEHTRQLIKETNFEYFHTEIDRFGQIEDSKNISADAYLLKCVKRFKNKTFPFQGPFFRGCIRISKIR